MTKPPSLFGQQRRKVDLTDFQPSGEGQGPTRPSDEELNAITEGTKFVSREAPQKRLSELIGRRPPRLYRSNRTRTVSIKTTEEHLERFYQAADLMGLKVAETFEIAVDLVYAKASEGQK